MDTRGIAPIFDQKPGKRSIGDEPGACFDEVYDESGKIDEISFSLHAGGLRIGRGGLYGMQHY